MRSLLKASKFLFEFQPWMLSWLISLTHSQNFSMNKLTLPFLLWYSYFFMDNKIFVTKEHFNFHKNWWDHTHVDNKRLGIFSKKQISFHFVCLIFDFFFFKFWVMQFDDFILSLFYRLSEYDNLANKIKIRHFKISQQNRLFLCINLIATSYDTEIISGMNFENKKRETEEWKKIDRPNDWWGPD